MTANQVMEQVQDITPQVRAVLHGVPVYWEVLRDYWAEANDEGGNAIPATWDAFIRDFKTYVRVLWPLDAESILSKFPKA